VTDGQTGGQTDGQTELRWLRRAIAVPAVARKNGEKESGNHASPEEELVVSVRTNSNASFSRCMSTVTREYSLLISCHSQLLYTGLENWFKKLVLG